MGDYSLAFESFGRILFHVLLRLEQPVGPKPMDD
jgi:hypothetical protein